MRKALTIIGLAVLLLSMILYINKVKDYKIEELIDPPAHAESIVEAPVSVPEPVPVPESTPEPIVQPEPPAPQKPVYAPMSDNAAKDWIYMKESSMRLDAVNSIGACGLGQSLPCSKMESVCPDWRTNYACQDAWFTNYVNARYGGWSQAQQFWIAHGWY